MFLVLFERHRGLRFHQRLHGHNLQIFCKRRLPQKDRALRIRRKARPVKHQFVLPADGVHVHQRDMIFFYKGQDGSFAFFGFTYLKGTCVRGQNHLSSGGTRLSHNIRMPQIFTNGESQPDAVDFDDDRLIPGREHPRFIKNPVLRQMLFEVERFNATAP